MDKLFVKYIATHGGQCLVKNPKILINKSFVN